MYTMCTYTDIGTGIHGIPKNREEEIYLTYFVYFNITIHRFNKFMENKKYEYTDRICIIILATPLLSLDVLKHNIEMVNQSHFSVQSRLIEQFTNIG